MSSNWENIPGDLLRKIEDRVIWCADKVRLSCVCKSWQSELGSHSRFQLPLLLLASGRVGDPDKIYDISGNKTYYLDLRQLQDYNHPGFYGSSHGWVIAEAYKNGISHLFMFDPLTGHKKLLEKQFPSFSSPYGTQRLLIRKCVVQSNPNLGDDHMVVVLALGSEWTLACTIGKNADWNKMVVRNLVHIIFYQGRLYGLTYGAQLMLIELGSSSKGIQYLSPESSYSYNETQLVDSCVGLLMVERIVYRDDDDFTTRRFRVYKFEFREGQWSSDLSEIGGDTLFFGRDSKSVKLGRGCGAELFKPNTIYYFDLDGQDRDFDNLRAFDLKTGEIEELPGFKRKVWQIEAWLIPASY